jgi:hypothetical protein
MFYLYGQCNQGDQPLAMDSFVRTAFLSFSFPTMDDPSRDLTQLESSDGSSGECDASGGREVDVAGQTVKSEEKLKKRGIELKPCRHVFCGVSPCISTVPSGSKRFMYIFLL